MIARKLTTSALKRPVPSAPVASKLKLRATWRSVSGIQPGKRSKRVPRDRPRVTIALRRADTHPVRTSHPSPLPEGEGENQRKRADNTSAPKRARLRADPEERVAPTLAPARLTRVRAFRSASVLPSPAVDASGVPGGGARVLVSGEDQWLPAAVPRVLGPGASAGRRCGEHARRHLGPGCHAHVPRRGVLAHIGSVARVARPGARWAGIRESAVELCRGAGTGFEAVREPVEAAAESVHPRLVLGAQDEASQTCHELDAYGRSFAVDGQSPVGEQACYAGAATACHAAADRFRKLDADGAGRLSPPQRRQRSRHALGPDHQTVACRR